MVRSLFPTKRGGCLFLVLPGTFGAANSEQGGNVQTSARALRGPSFDALFMACGLYRDACALKDSRPENSIPKGASTWTVRHVVFYSEHLCWLPQKRSKKSLAQPKTLPPKSQKPRFGYPPAALWARPCTCPLPLKMDRCVLNYINHKWLKLQAPTRGVMAPTGGAQVFRITRPFPAVQN